MYKNQRVCANNQYDLLTDVNCTTLPDQLLLSGVPGPLLRWLPLGGVHGGPAGRPAGRRGGGPPRRTRAAHRRRGRVRYMCGYRRVHAVWFIRDTENFDTTLLCTHIKAAT